MNFFNIKNKKECKIIAHRGGNKEIENTIGAFISSANRSFYGIETDIHTTSDGKYILYHDDNTSRLTENNFIIEQTDYQTLRNLRFRDADRVNRKDIFMPSLEEYLDICKSYDKFCVLEIKNEMDETSINGILDIIESAKYMHKVIFISFFFKNLIHIRKKHPDALIQFLIDATEETLPQKLKERNFDMKTFNQQNSNSAQIKMLETLKYYRMDLDAWDQSTDKALIDACHQRGIKINVFTVNSLDEAERFIELGVDFLTTDALE